MFKVTNDTDNERKTMKKVQFGKTLIREIYPSFFYLFPALESFQAL